MSRTPVTLQLSTSAYYAALLLELLTEKMKRTPDFLPERKAWFDLAMQVADVLAEQMGGAAYGRGV